MRGFDTIPYNDLDALEAKLKVRRRRQSDRCRDAVAPLPPAPLRPLSPRSMSSFP
jgi:hypothetical protein